MWTLRNFYEGLGILSFTKNTKVLTWETGTHCTYHSGNAKSMELVPSNQWWQEKFAICSVGQDKMR